MIKKVEVLANIAVIFTSILLCSVLVKKHFFSHKQTVTATAPPPRSTSAPKSEALQPGTKISLPGIDWSQNNRTLVLALSTTCHFCSESARFYQKLQAQKPNDLRLVALFPQSVKESRTYLDKLGLNIADVVQSPLGSVRVSGTPTLLLLDKTGAVIDSWTGKLSDDRAAAVINRLSNETSQN